MRHRGKQRQPGYAASQHSRPSAFAIPRPSSQPARAPRTRNLAENRLRRKGIPVGSDRGGYFYAVTAGEVYTTIRQLKAMSSGLEAAIHGLEQALERFGEREGEPYG